MITVRKSADRGYAHRGWLESHHTFSFADYYDPRHMGFGPLRVLNDDRVAPSAGFPRHPHRDMEILTYVLEGALEHRDSMGNGSLVRAGEVQRLTAGTGVVHSEYNASDELPVHFLQIWIEPDRRALEPSYEQRSFVGRVPPGELHAIAAPDGRPGALFLHQDTVVLTTVLPAGEITGYRLAPGRRAWVQMVRGAAVVNGVPLAQGDGAGLLGETDLSLGATHDAEVLVFDLA